MYEEKPKDRWPWVALTAGLISAIAISIFLFTPNGWWKIPVLSMAIVSIIVFFLNPNNILLWYGSAIIVAGLAGLTSLDLKLAAFLPDLGPLEASIQSSTQNTPVIFLVLTFLGASLLIFDFVRRGWLPSPLASEKISTSTSPPHSRTPNSITIVHELASAEFFVDSTSQADQSDDIQTLSMRCTYTFTCRADGDDEVKTFYLQFQRNNNTALQWCPEHAELMSQTFTSTGRDYSSDSLTILEAAESLQKIRIDFHPPLQRRDGLVTLSFVRENPQSQLLSMEDIRLAISAGRYSPDMQFCSQGRTVFQSTKQLTIECSFPDWYRPWEPRPRVTHQSSEIPELQNELRIEYRTDVPIGFRLCVPENLIHKGYVYAIVWQPPTRTEITLGGSR